MGKSMMQYRLTLRLNDGLSEPPPLEISVDSVDELLSWIKDDIVNDYDEPFPPGFTLLIERID